jgi:FkbM family methyltransferase
MLAHDQCPHRAIFFTHRSVPGYQSLHYRVHCTSRSHEALPTFVDAIRRSREEYYFSRVVSVAARPLHSLCSGFARQIEMKVKRNGVSVRLANGAIMRLVRDAGVSLASALYWHGIDGHEPETSKALRFFFERSVCFVDVGANYGFYSVLGALWNPELRVVAFEPLAPIFAGLRKNVVANRLEQRVLCENVALSSQTGTATLYLPPGGGKDLESTGTLSFNSWQVRHESAPIPVQSVRLDDYELQHPMQVDLIKIDVEDFEADVLLGMERVIRRDRPFIICEILLRNREHKNERTREIIEQLNYTPYWITDSGIIRVSRFDFERRSTNFLLSPADSGHEVLPDPTVLFELQQRKRVKLPA